MIIKKISLEKFKPLMHCGNTGITINVSSAICVLIGNNGSGKSTILGEITPLPAISSKYEVGGYKKITIHHNGHEYVATSKFNKKGGEHSLTKDGIELNTSGNAPMQTDLCADEFGLTNIVKTIITGDVSMCGLSRVQRKQLLLACYPSDLTFVLSHHKRILREMKDTQANVKMLVERKAELESKLLPPDVIEKKQELIKLLMERYNTAQRIHDRIVQEIQQVEGDEYFSAYNDAFTFEQFATELKQLRKLIAHHRNYSPDLFTDDPALMLSSLREKLKHLHTTKDRLSNDLYEAVKEMELLESVDSDELTDKITSIATRIKEVQQLLKHHTKEINTNLGCASKADEQVRDAIIDKIVSVSSIQLLSVEELNEKRAEWNALKERERSLTNRLDEASKRLASVNKQINTDTSQTFRAGCELACPARENHASVIQALMVDKEELEQLIDKLHDEQLTTLKYLSKAESTITEMEPYVETLKQIFRELDATNTVSVLQQKPLSKVINEQVSQLISDISIVFKNRVHTDQVELLERELENLHRRLADLSEAKRKVDGISDTQKAKTKSTLMNIDSELSLTNGDIVLTNKSIDVLEELVALKRVVNDKKEIFQRQGSAHLLHEKRRILEEQQNTLSTYITKIRDMVFNEEQQMRSVDAITIRMNQEILPELNKRESELVKLSALERALSPATGLPHKYMVEFINTIFGMVNHTIRCVWNYSMELVPLDVEATLTFDFPIIIHEHGRLKDIAMLSKGQKEIIDLAFTLALYMVKDLSGKFPLKLDEVDSGMSEHHRTQLLVLFKELLDSGDVEQMFLVNHHNQMFTAFTDAQIVCLQSDGIILPEEYNIGVDIH